MFLRFLFWYVSQISFWTFLTFLEFVRFGNVSLFVVVFVPFFKTFRVFIFIFVHLFFVNTNSLWDSSDVEKLPSFFFWKIRSWVQITPHAQARTRSTKSTSGIGDSLIKKKTNEKNWKQKHKFLIVFDCLVYEHLFFVESFEQINCYLFFFLEYNSNAGSAWTSGASALTSNSHNKSFLTFCP